MSPQCGNWPISSEVVRTRFRMGSSMSHSNPINERRQKRPYVEAETDDCQAWQAGKCSKGRKCPFRHAKYRRTDSLPLEASGAPNEEDRTAETEPSEQFIVLESNLVTYGAGLEIRKITPGYDLCQFTLHFPINTTKEDIENLFRQQGFAALDFYVLKIGKDEESVWAVVFANMQDGTNLKMIAQGLRKRGVDLEVRRNEMWTSGTTGRPGLTLTWDSTSERRMTRRSSNSSSATFSTVYEILCDGQGARMKTCHLSNPNVDSVVDREALTVEFDTWENAQATASTIEAKEIPSLGCTVHRPYQYSTRIPFAQYKAQKKQWLDLTKRKKKREARVKIDIAGEELVTIQVEGQNRTLTGVLKMRAEKLAIGEILEGTCWHPSFVSSKDSAPFFQHLTDTTAVHLRCDQDVQALRLYGGPNHIDQARRVIQEEVQRREQVITKTRLTGPSVAFFKRGGLGRLKELVGEDKVDLKVTSNRTTIAVPGSEEATHHFRRLLEESFVERGHTTSDKLTCPVCFNEALHPERLACGHAYCSGCLNNLLASVVDNKRFPIMCIGNGATCNVPIALAFIRLFLPQQTFKSLLEAAFVSYLEQNSQFQYCGTSGCTQTYHRQTSQAVVLSCPSCLAQTCSTCGVEHDSRSCEEYQLQLQDRLFFTLARSKGYRRCPGCKVVVEKNGGCDSMWCSRCHKFLYWQNFKKV